MKAEKNKKHNKKKKNNQKPQPDWLREDGYQVEAAENGLKALEKFKGRSWDIALVDLKMPAMDGLELMQKIKETRSETQVVIITAYATVNTAVQAIKTG